MALNKGKHIVEEIDGVRCSLVEKGVSPTRTEFLKKLLELNKYTVKVASEGESGTFKIGVTDMLFNPGCRCLQTRFKKPDRQKSNASLLASGIG